MSYCINRIIVYKKADRRLWDILERTCQGKFLFVKYCVRIIGRVKTAVEFRMR